MIKKRKLVIAVTGASGAIYAQVLLDKLLLLTNEIEKVGVIMSDNAKTVWEYELQNTAYEKYESHFDFYHKMDFNAPFASGSASFDTMCITPCSMGTLARIAGGISSDLISRAADVMLKERRKLIVVTRDTPLNLIHIQNMERLTLAGGIICPASPSFYGKPQNFEELAATVVDRVLSLAGFEVPNAYKWGE